MLECSWLFTYGNKSRLKWEKQHNSVNGALIRGEACVAAASLSCICVHDSSISKPVGVSS
ncbi:hypothetical protein E2C01_001744 [Portunus trituberculatus]|uniref:Uncharacterized protein n=1 Tax=Portunus trituberculatus TaxID=210409 RepID=A0A5B7CK15_PORTR|nr:hypothetical protein [Portunus trituberculatus]